MTRHFDILIVGGTIYDGRGGRPYVADVGVAGDRIEAVGDLCAASAERMVEAAGRWVCPGFIDAHSHSDTYVLLEPSCASKIYQGVTTEIVGQCGASAAPRVGAWQMPSDWREKDYPGTWSSVEEYRALFEQVRPAVNVRMLIGHNTLRAGVMGYGARQASTDEVRAMADVLARAMDEGGAGLSTGLIYAPGMFAARDEIVALARVAAKRGGIYATHMRSEGAHLIEAIEEALEIGARSGAPVQISHLKTSGRKNWHKIEAALVKIRAAREAGLDVTADRYPYTAANTDLDVILPEWAAGGGRDEVLRRLRDPEIRRTIRDEMLGGREAAYWDHVMIATTYRAENARFRGRRLTEIAKELGVEPVDAALHLMDTDDLHTTAVFFGMSEENMWRILGEPYVMIGSDASVRAPSGPLSHDHPHPRAYGTFPRFIRGALDHKTVSPEEAIRKMTSLPAERFKLHDRGVVAAGRKADLIVLNPRVLRDRATYEQPHQLAEGMETVIVNGTLTLANGEPTGSRSGRFL